MGATPGQRMLGEVGRATQLCVAVWTAEHQRRAGQELRSETLPVVSPGPRYEALAWRKDLQRCTRAQYHMLTGCRALLFIPLPHLTLVPRQPRKQCKPVHALNHFGAAGRRRKLCCEAISRYLLRGLL